MKPNEPNQGEGDREADREYREGVREFISQGKVSAAAKDAKDFVEREPAAAKRAERVAKRGPRLSVDDLIEMGQTVVDRVRRAAVTLRERFLAKNHK
jgi:hypothetical protein